MAGEKVVNARLNIFWVRPQNNRRLFENKKYLMAIFTQLILFLLCKNSYDFVILFFFPQL